MSTAVAVSHGPFGRAAIYHLDRPLSTHVHRESHLAFYLYGGRLAQMTVDQEDIILEPGRAVAINPWQPHSFIPSPVSEQTAVLLLYIDKKWLMANSTVFDSPLAFHRASLHLDPPGLDNLNYLASTLKDGITTPDVITSLLSRLVSSCMIAANSSDTTQNNDQPTTSYNHIQCTDSRIRKAIVLMSENVSEATQLENLAAQAGISRPHFFKLFKEQTGITPKLYLNTLRMEKAIDSLIKTDLSVAEIGHSLGYHSQPSFSRFFYMNVGIPPSDYRQRMRVFT